MIGMSFQDWSIWIFLMENCNTIQYNPTIKWLCKRKHLYRLLFSCEVFHIFRIAIFCSVFWDGILCVIKTLRSPSVETHLTFEAWGNRNKVLRGGWTTRRNSILWLLQKIDVKIQKASKSQWPHGIKTLFFWKHGRCTQFSSRRSHWATFFLSLMQ